MFDLSFVDAGAESRRPWTFTVSLLSQGLLLALIGIASLIAGPELPFQQWTAVFLEPPLPPAAAPPPREQPAVQMVEPEVFQADLVQPTAIPDKVALIVEEAQRPALEAGPGVVGATGPQGGIRNGVIDGIARAVPSVAPPPPPPPPADPLPPKTPQSIQVSSTIQAAKLLRKVAPEYPRMALQTRTHGVVHLRAVIAEDGSIEQLETLGGHPFLVRAAIDAVRQWRYRPTLLNDKPVRVVTQVDVHFKLN